MATNLNNGLQTIWNYLHTMVKLEKSDAILVFGSHDIGTAKHAIKLFKERWAPLIIFSGGIGKITKNISDTPEADKFAEIATKEGVPTKNVLIENKSTNTRENIIFTKKLLAKEKVKINKLIIVTKPYMERRAYATIMKFWPNIDVIPSSENILIDKYLERYPKSGLSKEDVVALIVGEVNRILTLPERGMQIKQDVSQEVTKAYKRLVELGYTKVSLERQLRRTLPVGFGPFMVPVF